MSQDYSLGNINRSAPVDLLTEGDFTDEDGFFIRAEVGGVIKYCPLNNEDSEAITKYFYPSTTFVDPEICRKIFNLGVVSPAQASGVYIGYGV